MCWGQAQCVAPARGQTQRQACLQAGNGTPASMPCIKQEAIAHRDKANNVWQTKQHPRRMPTALPSPATQPARRLQHAHLMKRSLLTGLEAFDPLPFLGICSAWQHPHTGAGFGSIAELSTRLAAWHQPWFAALSPMALPYADFPSSPLHVTSAIH